MKIYILLVPLFLLYSEKSLGQTNKANYILALSVDLYINTTARVSCDNFTSAFNKILTTNVITQTDSIKTFLSFVDRAKYVKHNTNIDARCKFIYKIDSSRMITVCTDGRNILLNERIIKKDRQFIHFLNSIVHRYP